MAVDNVLLKLECADLDDSRIQGLASDLARSLRDEGVGEAAMQRDTAGRGQKGDAATIGTIVLALIQTGGVAVTLLQVLKAYLARKSTMRFELTRPDGQKIVLDAAWFGRHQLDTARSMIADFLKD